MGELRSFRKTSLARKLVQSIHEKATRAPGVQLRGEFKRYPEAGLTEQLAEVRIRQFACDLTVRPVCLAGQSLHGVGQVHRLICSVGHIK